MITNYHPARRAGRAPRHRDRTALPAPDAGGGVRDARGGAAARPARSTRSASRGSCPSSPSRNPTDANVLLYDGEELLGAKQNRILNVTVLVAARSTTPIPVSCVEEGRWSRRSASFASAPHAAHPELRRRKAQRLAAEPLARGVAQSEVWDEVRAKSARMRRPLPDRRAGRRLPLAGGRAARARAGVPAPARPVRRRCSRSATTSASTTSRGRRRSRASTRSCAPATCSTRSSGSTGSPPTRATLDAVRRRDRAARNARPAALGRPRRGHAPPRRARRRLRARARRRAAPALRLHRRRASSGRIARPSRRR